MKQGYLDVGNGHTIYFEEWGNPHATPIFYFHGGPGGNFSEETKLLFNPKIHHVIFHDQRGCGKSTPYAETRHNTTQDLVEDVEKLADHLQIKKFTVMGGSWGSTLTLFYALYHPERINRIIIWSVYLASQLETDFVNEGYPRYTFPEAWERFISLVPQKNRKNGDTIMKYYAEKIRSKDKKIAKKYADEWTLWEMTLTSISYDQKSLEREILNEDNTSVAVLETHYFLNKCFVPKNFILKSVGKIKHIPCHVIQGRFDLCTPAIGAYNLSRKYGKKLTLQWTNAGHLRTDPENFIAIRTILNSLQWTRPDLNR